MSKKEPKIFPKELKALIALGERIRLARKRRKIGTAAAAARADVSRMTLHRVEQGSPKVAMGTYFRVLSMLHLESGFNLLAQDDSLGRELQDLALRRKES